MVIGIWLSQISFFFSLVCWQSAGQLSSQNHEIWYPRNSIKSIGSRLYIIITMHYIVDIIILYILPLFASFQYKYLPKPYKAFKDEDCVVKQGLKTADRGWPIYTYKSCLNRCFALVVSKMCRCIGFSDILYGLQFPVSFDQKMSVCLSLYVYLSLNQLLHAYLYICTEREKKRIIWISKWRISIENIIFLNISNLYE